MDPENPFAAGAAEVTTAPPSFLVDIVTLLAFQFGIGLVAGILFTVFQSVTGFDATGSWMSVLAAMFGAQFFAQRREAKHPGGLAPPLTYRLAGAAVGVQFALTVPFALVVVSLGGDLAGLLGDSTIVGLILGALVCGGVVTFAATLWGFRTGIKSAQVLAGATAPADDAGDQQGPR